MAMSLETMGKTHCLTFDIEEHFQVSAFESPMRRRHWYQAWAETCRMTGSTPPYRAGRECIGWF